MTSKKELFSELKSLKPWYSPIWPFGSLERCTKLSIMARKATSLPPAIFELTGLRWLDVSGNQISSLPANISRLTAMESLSIENNPIQELPVEITHLKNLKRLYVEHKGNISIKFAPRDISTLPVWTNKDVISDIGMTMSFADALRKIELCDISAFTHPTSSPFKSSSIGLQEIESGKFSEIITTGFEQRENLIHDAAFRHIYRVELKSGTCAIKVISQINQSPNIAKWCSDTKDEAISFLKHPNIITLFDIGLRGGEVLFIMEFAGEGDLCRHISNIGPLGNASTIRLGLQIIQGIQFLDGFKNIVPDFFLCTEHVLLSNGIAKISWYHIPDSRPENIQSSNIRNWSPPEFFESRKSLGLPSQVYAFGVVLWSMLSGKYPHEVTGEKDIEAFVLGGHLLQVPETSHPRLCSMIPKCWEANPDCRLLASHVEAELSHGI